MKIAPARLSHWFSVHNVVMQSPGARFSLPFPLGILLGLLLIGMGGDAIYHEFLRKSANPKAIVSAALLCKIYPAVSGVVPENPSANPQEVTLLSGATLTLTGAPKASLDQTVVVDLCVQANPELPESKYQALRSHLLVRLSAVGLQIEPPNKIPTVASERCLGTAAWTVRANTPGRYTAIVLPESTDRQPSHQPRSNPQWDFSLAQPAQLNIQFQPKWSDYVGKSWGVISTVLGTILVFTQVMLNLRQRKKAEAG